MSYIRWGAVETQTGMCIHAESSIVNTLGEGTEYAPSVRIVGDLSFSSVAPTEGFTTSTTHHQCGDMETQVAMRMTRGGE